MQTSPYAPPGTDELTAPWNQPDDTRQGFECLVCHAVGYESYPSSDDFVDDLGSSLERAQRTPNNGWVCSKSHLSQAMFEAASDKEKRALQRVEVALRELEAHSSQLRGLLETWGAGKSHSALAASSENFREAIAYYETPKWVNENEAREDVLEQAVTKAIFDLEIRPVIGLKSRIKVELDNAAGSHSDPYRNGTEAEVLASVGNVILRLKEAVGE